MTHWIGTMLHLLYPPKSEPPIQAAFAALADQRREHIGAIGQSRASLERIATDPLDGTLQSIIKDL